MLHQVSGKGPEYLLPGRWREGKYLFQQAYHGVTLFSL